MHKRIMYTCILAHGVYVAFNSLNHVDDAAYNSLAQEYATGCLLGTRINVWTRFTVGLRAQIVYFSG